MSKKHKKPGKKRQEEIGEKIAECRRKGVPPKQAAAIAYEESGVPEKKKSFASDLVDINKSIQEALEKASGMF